MKNNHIYSDQSISGGVSRGLAALLTARSGGYLPARGVSLGRYGLPSIGLARFYRDGAHFRASEICSPALSVLFVYELKPVIEF